MKLALFHNPNSGKPYVGDELTEKHCNDMTRMSEWVEVHFPPISAEARKQQLALIEGRRNALRVQYEQQLARINEHAATLQS